MTRSGRGNLGILKQQEVLPVIGAGGKGQGCGQHQSGGGEGNFAGTKRGTNIHEREGNGDGISSRLLQNEEPQT